MILLLIATIVFTGIYFLFPYTDMGKQIYETNRQNAMNYILTVQMNPLMLNDEDCLRQVRQIMVKYGMGEVLVTSENITDYFKGEANR